MTALTSANMEKAPGVSSGHTEGNSTQQGTTFSAPIVPLHTTAAPHDAEAESKVLGAAMLFPNRVMTGDAGSLRVADFHVNEHREIWRAILALHSDDAPIDSITVADRLTDMGALDKAGGYAGVCKHSSPTAEVDYYADIIRKHSTTRAAMQALTAAQARIAAGVDATEALRELAATVDTAAMVTSSSTIVSGGSFLFDDDDDTEPLWGDGDSVLWAEGESLMITGTPGVGKTTLGQQVVLSMLGVGRGDVLGFPVARRDRVLYLAMDRPKQIKRSMRRMVDESQRPALDAGLAVHKGPPPEDIARDTGVLLRMARQTGASVIVLDSLKDAALGITTDEVGAAVNRAFQACLAADIDVLILHHQVKRSGSGDGGRPVALADVYGSGWITAGVGSCVLIHGEAGDSTVELRHLKQPAEPVGPLKITHDHHAGTTTLAAENVDPLLWLRAQPLPVTAMHLASAMAAPDAPDKKAGDRARRAMERLVREGLAEVVSEAQRGGATGSTPATYRAAERPGQGTL